MKKTGHSTPLGYLIIQLDLIITPELRTLGWLFFFYFIICYVGCNNSTKLIFHIHIATEAVVVCSKDPRAPSVPGPSLTASLRLVSPPVRSINQSQQFYKPYLQSCLCHKCPWMDAYGGRGAVQGTAFSPSPVDITERHVIRSVCGS